jgi:phytoene desaturase
MTKKVSVIGAGFAGLSGAAYLAQKGFEVTLFEKNNQPGGRCRVWEQDGYRFDMGPSWYWMPEVFEEFFQNFGFKASDFYELERLSPSYRVFFQDEHVDMPSDPGELNSLFDKLEPGSGKRLTAFLKDAAYRYQTALKDYVKRPSHSIWEFMELNLMIKAFRMKLFSPVRKEISRVASNPKLVSILEFPVLFLGSTPANTPALYSMLNHADMALGTWYPKKGMAEISKAFYQVALKQGVKFRFNEEVKEIKVKENKVQALVTSTGIYQTDVLLAAGDYHHVEQQLLEKQHRVYDEKYWESRTMSPSSLLFYLGIDGQVPNLLHHNLFFDEDFNAHAKEIYDTPKWPQKPLFYVCAPSKSDSTVAPPGCENLFVLIPLAAGLEDNEQKREAIYNLVMDRLEQKSGTEIRSRVKLKRSYCVSDFEADYHAYKGNAYGLANTLMQTAFLKPKMKSSKLSNLYYTGQLTVPGPGVPPAIISGSIAANEIEKDFK